MLTVALGSTNTIYKTTEGQITFVSAAEFETITATSQKLTGALDTSSQMFAFYVTNNSFEGFNSLLQQDHFNESYMESEKNPRSFFTGKIIEQVTFSKPGNYGVRAKGKLNIHGVEQERIIRCDLIIDKDEIKVKSDFSIFLAEHDISIPKIAFEKIAPEIQIHVSAVLKPKSE